MVRHHHPFAGIGRLLTLNQRVQGSNPCTPTKHFSEKRRFSRRVNSAALSRDLANLGPDLVVSESLLVSHFGTNSAHILTV